MSLERTIHRLRREATTNPKKAGFLGLMLLVALYFWAPLVWGWVGKGARADIPKESDPNAALLPQSLAGPTPTQTTKSPQPETPPPPWQTVVQWIDSDPRMQPASPPSDARDPFRNPDLPIAKKVEEKPETIKKPVTAETLGLVLSGTIVGPNRRAAVINGKTYREGATIELTSEGRAVKLKILEIKPQQTLVQYDGTQWVLKLPMPAHAGRIEPGGKTD